MQQPDDFEIRNDDWSWQLIGPSATRLFIRITSDRNDKATMTFSDFIIHSAPREMVQSALNVVRTNFRGPSGGMRLQFLDILPVSPYGELEKGELTARHDQIVSTIREFGADHGFVLTNSLLEPRNGKYDTIVTT